MAKSPKRSFKISPLRWLGKTSLKTRSERYRRAVEFVDKADDLIREAALNQKAILKDMKSIKKNLSGALFSERVDAFIKEQKAINAIVSKMEQTFAQLAGDYGNLNMAINEEVLKTPEGEYRSKESHEDYIKRITDELDSSFEKTAFLGGYYWKTRTESGKKLSKAFETVYTKLNYVFDKNLNVLKQLDEVRDIGDPQKYLTTAMKKDGLIDIDLFIQKNKDLKDAIDQYFQQSKYKQVEEQAKQEEKPVEESKPESKIEVVKEPEKKEDVVPNKPLEYTENKEVSSTTMDIAPKQEVITPSRILDINPKQEVITPSKIVDVNPEPKLEQQDELEVALKNLPTPKLKPPSLPKKDDLRTALELQSIVDEKEDKKIKSPQSPPRDDLQLALTLQSLEEPSLKPSLSPEQKVKKEMEDIQKGKLASDEDFMNYLTKLAEEDNSQIKIAIAILDYANEIESVDENYAMRLTAIAEDILNV